MAFILQEPIYKSQKGENKRAYHYFKMNYGGKMREN